MLTVRRMPCSRAHRSSSGFSAAPVYAICCKFWRASRTSGRWRAAASSFASHGAYCNRKLSPHCWTIAKNSSAVISRPALCVKHAPDQDMKVTPVRNRLPPQEQRCFPNTYK